MRRSSSPILARLCSALVGMIAWWSVTLASSTTRPSGSTSRPWTYSAARPVVGVAADVAGDRLELGDHVAGQVARVGARIGQRLVLLVEALGRAERAARGEPVAVVGLALQRREVVEERRLLLARRLVELGDLAGAGRERRRRSPRPPAPPGSRGWAPGVVAALVAALARGLEGGVDEPVLLGDEGADLLLAPREDRQRRRLHAAERDGAVEARAQADRRGARRVHADDPVGLRARARGGLQQAQLLAVAQAARTPRASPPWSSRTATGA